MKLPVTDLEAKHLLDKVTRASRAKAILASRPQYAFQGLVSSLATGLAIYVTNDFAAPLAVKILITVGFVAGVLGQIDAWILQRRLEAAIELLHQSQSETA